MVETRETVQAKADAWLRANDVPAFDVEYVVLPLGFVVIWIERAQHGAIDA